jgi:hypothetical protein
LAHGTGPAKLHRAGSATIIQHPARTAGTVETSKCEYLAGYKLEGLIGIHLSSDGGTDHCTGCHGSHHQTRKHAVITPA